MQAGCRVIHISVKIDNCSRTLTKQRKYARIVDNECKSKYLNQLQRIHLKTKLNSVLQSMMDLRWQSPDSWLASCWC